MVSDLVISKYHQALRKSCPPIVINPGLNYQSLYNKNNCYRIAHMNRCSFEDDIWEVCKPDKDLANAVYDYAQEVANVSP